MAEQSEAQTHERAVQGLGDGPGHTTALSRVRRVLLEQHEQRPAAQQEPLASFSSLVDGRVEHLLEEAQGFMMQCHWQAATMKLTRAIAVCGTNPKLYELRGECALQMTDFKVAALNFTKALFHQPGDEQLRSKLVQSYLLLGQCLYDMALFKEALEAFDAAIAFDEHCPLKYQGCRLSCLAMLGQHSDCMALVNGLLEVHEDNADLLVARARLYKLFAKDNHSFYDLQMALEIDADHEQALKLLEELQQKAVDSHSQAIKLALSGNFEEALKKVSAAIQSDPSAATFHILRGAIHRQLGNFPAAVDDFIVAKSKVGLDHRDSPVHKDACRHLSLTYNELAVECYRKSFYNEAIVLLNKAIGEEKTEAGIYVNRGDCFYRTGELDFAYADYEQAMLLDPSEWAVRGRVAIVNCQQAAKEYARERYEKSLQLFNTAIAAQPAIAEAYGQRARVQYMLKHISETRRDVLAALYLDATEETALSLASRLFPGITAQQLMLTAEGRSAGLYVERALEDCSTFNPSSKWTGKQVQDGEESDASSRTSKAVESLKDTLGSLLVQPQQPKTPGLTRFVQKTKSSLRRGEDSRAVVEISSSILKAAQAVTKGEPAILAQAGDKPSTTSKQKFKFHWPKTKLSARLQDGLPLPERAAPPLKVCLADLAFNEQLVKAKKRVDREVSHLRETHPSLKPTRPHAVGVDPSLSC